MARYNSPSLATPSTRSFRLEGADGGPLRGDVRSAAGARPAVVICHGFKGSKDWGFFPRIADRLARAGFTAVSFNFSGSGVGEGGETFDEIERFAHMTYSNTLRDLAIVLEALDRGDLGPRPATYGLLGHSMGGAIAVLRAATDERTRALVTWGGVARFGSLWSPDVVPEWRRTGRTPVVNQRTGQVLWLSTNILDDLEAHGRTTLDVLRAAAAVRAPWLIAHGADDESVPVDAAHDLARAARPGTAELMVVAGTGHTLDVRHPWAGPTPAYERVAEATVAWLARHLG